MSRRVVRHVAVMVVVRAMRRAAQDGRGEGLEGRGVTHLQHP
ncbi:MAG: hypothetical protein R3C16_11610 [Hyphomonadaceae bacterium]